MNRELFERLGGREPLMRLLRHFYADVRQHRLLGPLFDAHIEDWPKHLEVIGDFWSTMTGGPAVYSGRMPLRHVPLGLREEHFQAWLGLWEHHCRAGLPSDCATEMIERAQGIALRLRAICGVPVSANVWSQNAGEVTAFAPQEFGFAKRRSPSPLPSPQGEGDIVPALGTNPAIDSPRESDRLKTSTH
ncbi:MAG: group III truncated hemoglobin [Verrucomicrobiota bacterium]